jgi:hypothetical protein
MTTLSTNTVCRFGNRFVRHLAVCILAEKHDLQVTYDNYELISEQLGVFLYSGKNIHSDSIILDDFNYIPIFQQSEFSYNLDPNIHYFQTREISQLINNYLHRDDIKENIIHKNRFQERYNNNNDLYIHIRLGDAAQWNAGVQYYLNAISKIQCDNIYLSTDQVDGDIIKHIIHSYPNANILMYDEIRTIQFASTCKHIILSHGSFSAVIGHLAFCSNIYYPKFEVGKNDNMWCGDMFSINGWIKFEDF